MKVGELRDLLLKVGPELRDLLLKVGPELRDLLLKVGPELSEVGLCRQHIQIRVAGGLEQFGDRLRLPFGHAGSGQRLDRGMGVKGGNHRRTISRPAGGVNRGQRPRLDGSNPSGCVGQAAIAAGGAGSARGVAIKDGEAAQHVQRLGQLLVAGAAHLAGRH